MRHLRITVAYDGTDFAGWQRQADARTVQATIEDALAPFVGTRVVVTGAGRTDAGVHAAGQVASLAFDASIGCEDLRRALNATLPTDLRIVDVTDVHEDFNARFDALRKTYRYLIVRAEIMPPVWRRFAWHIPQPLDALAMNSAASLVCGEHDFAGFQAAGSAVSTSVRTIFVSEVTTSPLGDRDVELPLIPHQTGHLVRFTITGSGFLRHMVRNIVGTVVEIGRGRRAIEDVEMILQARSRALASPTAPPHGLILWSVEY